MGIKSFFLGKQWQNNKNDIAPTDTNVIASQINPVGGNTDIGMYFHINQGDGLNWYYSTTGSHGVGWTGVGQAYNFSALKMADIVYMKIHNYLFP